MSAEKLEKMTTELMNLTIQYDIARQASGHNHIVLNDRVTAYIALLRGIDGVGQSVIAATMSRLSPRKAETLARVAEEHAALKLAVAGKLSNKN